MSVPLKNLRIVPREEDFLNRKSGLRGEIFFNENTGSLRLYNGVSGGSEVALANLSNVANADFLNKAVAAGVGTSGGNVTVSVSPAVPSSPSNGNLWLNTNNGSLYVYINDGNSSQWVQPAVPIPQLPSIAFSISADDSTQQSIPLGDTIQFVGAGGIVTTSDGNGVITIENTRPELPSIAFSIAADDSTRRGIPLGDTIQFVGEGGIVTSSDANGVITIENVGAVNTGNISFVGTTLDSTDSSGIIFTPAVTFNSDVTVENELVVRNVVSAKKFETTSVGVPELFSETNLNLSAVNAVVITRSPLRLAQFTTAQRDLITAQNGDIIYNTTSNKFQGYENGAWVNLV